MIKRVSAVLALLFGLSMVATVAPPESPAAARTSPNFVVIVVDDLDSGSVSYMPAVNRLLAERGATFSRFFATTPLCCPSRASILRGQYAHNHRVLRNTGDEAGFTAFRESGHESDTIATELDAAGYETALIGKYLNGYASPRQESTYVPPGWDFWVAGVDHDAYNNFNYHLNVNGKIVRHGKNARDYMTDVLAAHALDFLDQSAGSNQPFFLYLAPYAPHSPATPAPRHRGMFAGESAPRSPAFNERNVEDKPDWVQSSRLSEERIGRIDSGYRHRLESLMAVDEMIDVVVRRLDQRGALASTYIFFLSDNGYFLGEHRQPHGKDAPYDAATRVPLIARGPDIAEGSLVDKIALNIDLFPTIAELAGIAAPPFVDGRSLAPLFSGVDRGWRDVALIEGFGKETESNEGAESPTPPFRALRSEDTLFAEYETGEQELYELRKDPHQIANIAREAPKSLLREYSQRLDALAACAGSDCARLENDPIRKLSTGGVAERDGTEKSKARGDRKGKSKAKGKQHRAKIEQRRASAHQRDRHERLRAADHGRPGQRERNGLGRDRRRSEKRHAAPPRVMST
ncbi:MAG: sulfatase-like hydrolase/transferase [Thermomicrobiales bacterium]|nr:sulfatase-like hydrolase/transferase [Thermomicrobiales bacterium]